MVRAFIDSNVIANWILVNGRVNELKKKIKIKEQMTKEINKLLNKYPKLKPSYKLLEIIRTNELKEYTFIVSDLVIAEIYNVICEEGKAKKLHSNGIPFRYWPKYIYKIKLNIYDEIEIIDEIIKFVEIFIGIEKPINKIKHLERLKKPKKTWSEESILYDFGIFSGAILKLRCETYDALLFAQAFSEKCKYFVTEDSNLRKQLKKHKGKTKVVSAQYFLRDILKIKEKT